MTGWDFGTKDATALVLAERRGDSIRVLASTPEPPSRFRTIYERCVKTAETKGDEPFSLWPLTDETYAMWKANSGNAKARRRWRRRNLPNTQKPVKPWQTLRIGD